MFVARPTVRCHCCLDWQQQAGSREAQSRRQGRLTRASSLAGCKTSGRCTQVGQEFAAVSPLIPTSTRSIGVEYERAATWPPLRQRHPSKGSRDRPSCLQECKRVHAPERTRDSVTCLAAWGSGVFLDFLLRLCQGSSTVQERPEIIHDVNT